MKNSFRNGFNVIGWWWHLSQFCLGFRKKLLLCYFLFLCMHVILQMADGQWKKHWRRGMDGSISLCLYIFLICNLGCNEIVLTITKLNLKPAVPTTNAGYTWEIYPKPGLTGGSSHLARLLGTPATHLRISVKWPRIIAHRPTRLEWPRESTIDFWSSVLW